MLPTSDVSAEQSQSPPKPVARRKVVKTGKTKKVVKKLVKKDEQNADGPEAPCVDAEELVLNPSSPSVVPCEPPAPASPLIDPWPDPRPEPGGSPKIETQFSPSFPAHEEVPDDIPLIGHDDMLAKEHNTEAAAVDDVSETQTHEGTSPLVHAQLHGNADGGSRENAPLASPRIRKSKPSSPLNGYRNITDQFGRGTQGQPRRTSMYSHRSPPTPTPHAAHAPLPHHPQPHFYSAPHVDWTTMLRHGKGVSHNEEDRFYAFDTLAATGGETSDSTENVLLVGGRGHLDVFSIDRDRMGIVGHLQGLRGDVAGAKIIPWSARDDPLHALRPLVAVVLHGLESDTLLDPGKGSPFMSAADSAMKQKSDVSKPAFGGQQRRGNELQPSEKRYQTTVEIYSLRSSQYVTTIYSSPVVEATQSTMNPLFGPPGPIGALRIEASGRHVVVASGSSGELFIFGLDHEKARAGETRSSFRCLGKTWAAVQVHPAGTGSGSSNSSGLSSPGGEAAIGELDAGRAVFAVSQRWLGYVPAKPGAHPSIEGQPLLGDIQGKCPGLNHTAPPQPQINCAVDTPDAESLLNRVTREVTQEFLKGAKWVGDQGVQAWRSYWNRPAQTVPGPDGFNHGGDPLAYHTQQQHFPPTHAHANHQPQSGAEPVLVSILDLNRLDRPHDFSASHRLQPISTFPAPLGCSFMSFAPGGLALLTASRNGDVQTVWSLMKMIPSPGGGLPGTQDGNSKDPMSQGPHVRQVARFSRMTATTIVDVSWTAPIPDRLAILTIKGTVHMFDMPPDAFQWPPPRRAISKATAHPANSDELAQNNSLYSATGAAGHAVSAAVKMVNSKAQPLFDAARGRRSSSSGTGSGARPSIGSASSSRGAQSGRIVAHGLSKSLGAASETISHLRSIGENRIHLPGSGAMVAPGCVRWLTGTSAGLIGVVGDGVVRVQEVRAKVSSGKSGKRQSLVGGHSTELGIPNLSDLAPASSSHKNQTSMADEPTDETQQPPVTGYWNLRPPSAPSKAPGQEHVLHPLSQAEIETNPPYQPFHADGRVRLFTYDGELPIGHHHHHQASHSSRPWVFGQAIPATRVASHNTSEDGTAPTMAQQSQQGQEQEEEEEEEDLLEPIQNVVVPRHHHQARQPWQISASTTAAAADYDQSHQPAMMTAPTTTITTGRSRRRDDDIFEEDCEVLDLAL